MNADSPICASARERVPQENSGAWKASRVALVSVIATAIFGIAAVRSCHKPMWSDELFTYYISRLPHFSQIWAALRNGVDANPPLMYWLTRWAYALFGDGHFSTRLPQMASFAVFSVCMYAFVARRCGHVYGIVAMLLPLVSRAYEYAYEARAYGIVLGCCGLALVSWQAIEGRRRRLSIVVLSSALGCAILTHCYAILLVPAFQVSEAVRAWKRKCWDWQVAVAVTAPAALMVTYIPLFVNTKAVAVDNPVFAPTWAVIILAPQYLFATAAWPLLLGLIAALAAPEREDRIGGAGFTTPELVAAITLLALPIAGTLLAFTVTHIYFLRYGLPAVIGAVILLIHVVHNRVRGRTLPGIALAWVLGIWFFLDTANFMGRYSMSAAVAGVPEMIATAHSREPELAIVTANGLDFLPLDHYGSPALTQRLTFVYDQSAAVRYTGADIFDRSIITLPNWFPIRSRIEPYAAFIQSHRRFLMYGLTDFQLCWLHKKLQEDGAIFRLIDRNETTLLLEVSMPAPSGAVSDRF